MPKLTQDFNISPYYDDFDSTKNFYKILFRPGFSVQARELSQLQTILQKQIETLGDYVFSDGAKVYGGEVTLNTTLNSLQLKTNYSGDEIDVTNFEDRIITGQTSGARALIIKSVAFTQTSLNTLIINYLDEKTFVDDEIIQTTTSGTLSTYFANVAGAAEGLTGVTTLVTSISSDVTSTVSISEAIYYIGGYFVYVEPQTIVLDRLGNTPTYRIGLTVNEELITSVDDTSLLDNALGSSNYSAPGANRYKISLTFSKKDIFESGVPIVSSGVTFSSASNTVTITTSTDHNLSAGDLVVVSNTTQAEYLGKHTIASVPSGTTFTYFITGLPVTPATGSDIQYTKVITDPIERNSDENFIELLRVEDGVKTEEVTYPILGELEKTLARRTYDQSGDFTVKPFGLDVVQHKISGVASARTAANACTNFTGNGTNFASSLNDSDVIFLSGNTTRTGTISSITNNSVLTLSSGVTLGDGSDNQRIGIETKLTGELGPGKAYVKGYEYESISTKTVDINKARDTRTVDGESQGVNFGPYLIVTDLLANTQFDIGANTANGEIKGSGMDLVDLHMVKYPSTQDGHCASPSSPIIFTSNDEIDFVGIDTTSAATIANTKIGTARIRQLDFRKGRDSSVSTKYGTSGANTMHQVFPHVYDAHLFDFRFDKTTGTVGGAVANTTLIKLKTSGAQSFPTMNCLYGTTITVNTSFQGVDTSDTRTILSWSGANNDAGVGYDPDNDGSAEAANYHALLDSALTQQTRADSTYSINFGVKDVSSMVQYATTTIVKGLNVDPSGRLNGKETANTILYDNTDDRRSLIFPLQNQAVANLEPSGSSNTKFKFKRTFSGTLTQNLVTLTAPTGEKFYPGSDGTITTTVADANYIVSVKSGTHQGDIIEFSNTSGSGLHAGASETRTLVTSSSAGSLAINVQSDDSNAKNYAGLQLEVIATMQIDAATLSTSGSGIGKKVLVSGNTTGANALFNSANSVQATAGQIHFGTSMNNDPGANNSLKLADIKKLVAVVDSLSDTVVVSNTMVTAAIANSSSQYNITSRFVLNDGQKDNYYDYGKISLKPGETKPSGQVIAIVDYYTHSGQGPFTVDSYTWSGSGNTSYGEIPDYTSPATGNKINLRNVIDFRPKRIGIETANTDDVNYTNDITATSNVFAEKILPDYDFTFDTDYSHYIPRKDKIALSKDRVFKVIEGVSDINPVLPPDDPDAMTLYNLEIPAYTFVSSGATSGVTSGTTNGTSSGATSGIKVEYVDNRRFTMRDLGKLSKRVETLEYYTALSLLEKEADSLVITDTNNNDRFKNGIFADPFAGHNLGDVENLDYYAGIDFDKKHLRPPTTTDLQKLEFNSNTNFSTLVNNGGVITLPFSSSRIIDQPLTGSVDGKNVQKTYSINPNSLKNYIGQLSLDPPTDNWYDASNRADVKVNLEGQYDNWLYVTTANGHGTHYNDWEDIWSGVEVNNDVKKSVRDSGDVLSNNRKAKTTGQTKTLTGLKSGNVPEKITKIVGNKSVNISVVPKIREQTITFVAKGLKPNKNVYAYFGDTKITANVKQATLLTLSNVSTSNVFRTTPGNFEQITIQGSASNAGNTANVVYMSDRDSANGCTIMIVNQSTDAAFTVSSVIRGDDTLANGTISAVTNYSFANSEIRVNNEGVSAGVYNVQSGTFPAGEVLFRLTDEIDNIVATTTSVAEDIFHIKGVIENNRIGDFISTRPIILRREDITEDRIAKSSTIARQTSSNKYLNPMAQNFFVDENLYPFGLFLYSITLFFNAKDTSLGSKNPVTLQLRPTYNGIPSSSEIIPGSEVVLTPGRVTANTTTPSANASGGFPGATLGNSFSANKSGANVGSRTIFKFDMPVYLSAGEYSIVLITNNAEYKIYGFELGAKSTGTDRKITKQPYVGSFFKPTNAGVWNPTNTEGLMFQIDRCNFSTETGYARFDNKVFTSGNASSNTIMDGMKLVTERIEHANTTISNFFFATEKSGTTKNVAPTKFTFDKNIDFKTQKQITQNNTSANTQYQNSFTINVYMTSANSFISPVIDEHRTGVITILNNIDNADFSNSDILVTNSGAGLSQTEIGGDSGVYTTTGASDGNASCFVISDPDVGSNTATMAANVTAGGKINDVVIVNAGSGYLTLPTVTSNSSLTNTTLPTFKIRGEGANGSIVLSANVEHSRGGNITTKYISRRITLEEDFDARDIRVYINAYKPRGSEIYVYYKVLAGDDPDNFDDKPYILMTQETDSGLFSLNEDDFKQYTYETEDEYITYQNTDGARFNKFKTYAIKVVMTLDRNDQTTFIGIPKITDLRAVALDTEGKP